MTYYKVAFIITPCSQDACDLLSALAGEAGFETFEDSPEGTTGYVQQELFNEEALKALLADFPMPGMSIIYNVQETEQRDWNEQWELEGFEPIIIDDKIVIHDGRHLPEETNYQLSIEIDAHMAFGTGTHETTRMVCASLLELSSSLSQQKNVGCEALDCGCGTGILSICALKLGIEHVTAYDIDEWSTENTRHNAVINQVDNRIDILHGDSSVLNGLSSRFNIVMANINRNILLEDMPAFVRVMQPDATLILSGFYEDDIPMLIDKAQSLGLMLRAKRTDNAWACLVLNLSH